MKYLGRIFAGITLLLFVALVYLQRESPSVAHEVIVENHSTDVAEVALLYYADDRHVFGRAHISPGDAPQVVGEVGCVGRFIVSLRNEQGQDIKRSDTLSISKGWFGPRFAAKVKIGSDNSIAYTPAHGNFCNIS